MKQFVLPEGAAEKSGPVRLTGRDFHYLIRVRRYSVGDEISGITRKGERCIIVFETIGDDHCTVRLEPDTEADSRNGTDDSAARITLIPGITKGGKMELTVRQAVEAGASAVYPVLTDHCQVRYRSREDAEAKKKRWERIAVEALQQCGGSFPAEISTPEKLEKVISAWADRGPLFFLHEKELPESEDLFKHLAEPIEELGIIVGPEGGLSSGEAAFLLEHGAHPLYLGKRILRAETAALYGIAAVATIIRERSAWHPV